MWEPLDAANTLKDNQLLFINFPNTSKTQEDIKWGQDFPVIVQRMKATFDAIGLSKFEKKVVMAHDWGCFYAYLFDKVTSIRFRPILAHSTTSLPLTSLLILNSKEFLLRLW